MNHLPITLLYGSLSFLLLNLLGLNTSRARISRKAYIGDTPDPDLTRVIRAHGNASEWVPGLVLMLLLLELSGAPRNYLHIFGIAMVVGRLLHPIGVWTKTPLTSIGATITFLLMAIMPIYGLMIYMHG